MYICNVLEEKSLIIFSSLSVVCVLNMNNSIRIYLFHYFLGGGKVVFLQHGLLDSSHTWINNLRNQSLAFILADAGFDVWLGNSRGSTYSRRHRKLSPDQLEFWDFSWDDMADFDLPTALYYVLNRTKVQTLGYVGHSQGCQIALAHFGQNPDLQSRINVFIALAPAAYLGHMTSPVRIIAHYARTLENVWDLFGHGEFLPSTALIRFLGDILCRYDRVPSVLISFSLHSQTRLPVYLSHTPAGTSVRNIVHYCQAMISDNFQRFDYGEAKNMKKYGQSTPPEYKLSTLTMPIVLYNGGNDWLAVVTDITKLLSQIEKNVIEHYFLPSYNHLDFVWGMDALVSLYLDLCKPDYLSEYIEPDFLVCVHGLFFRRLSITETVWLSKTKKIINCF
ncbi:unnamed protein product [Echinostoma caproni]|uniref:Lipase n=1 Tax=Echinostoma caproni TaxID=27848 RepID=A0A183A780_9TREM|nr:unnamed protein product [Echinostoma caproni]